jgi:hypothetical protein
MDNTTVNLIIVLVVLAALAGFAYFLDWRRKRYGTTIGPALPDLGPIGKALLWIVRGSVIGMILSILGLLVLQQYFLIWILIGCVVVFIITNNLLRIVRIAGK